MQRILVVLVAVALACGRGPNDPSPPPPPSGCAGTPGVACFGQHNYIEYLPGDLPVVVSVPHGGSLTPASIPDRSVGTSVTDSNTIELGRAVAQAFVARTGRAPHLVIVHLRRTKLDANREVGEAAQGQTAAIQAWTEYHGFITQALTSSSVQMGRGLYIDLHGHGHAVARLELGYLLSSSTLGLSDADLNSSGSATQSSLRLAAPRTSATFAELLRGATSLGGLLQAHTPSVPSPAAPSPGDDPYFTGGYSTERHANALPAVQIESHFPGIRDTPANRAAFAEALAGAVAAFLATHLGLVI